MKERQLSDLAFARSGDKGNSSNIGVIAFDANSYELLKGQLTEEALFNLFKELQIKKIVRYLWPSINAINFLLIGSLERGGSVSLRLDAQGKGLAQKLLKMKIKE